MADTEKAESVENPSVPQSNEQDAGQGVARRPILTWVRLVYIVIFMPIAMYCAGVVIFSYSMSQSWVSDTNIGILLLYFTSYGVVFILPPICAILLAISFLRNFRHGVVCRIVALLFFAALSWPAYKQLPWELKDYWRDWQVRRVVAALLDGDAERALARANDMYKLPTKYVSYRNAERTKTIACAEAKEMMQKYDDALRDYSALDGDNQFHSFYARVYYKRGERERAFQEYCKFAETALAWIEPNDDKKRAPEEEEPNVSREIARHHVQADASVVRQLTRQRILYLEDDYCAPNFMPFKSYDEFLAFIEEEYAKCDETEKYERAVEFWRETANVKTEFYYRRNIRGLNGMLSIPPKFALCDDQQFLEEWNGYVMQTQRRNASIAVETPPNPQAVFMKSQFITE